MLLCEHVIVKRIIVCMLLLFPSSMGLRMISFSPWAKYYLQASSWWPVNFYDFCHKLTWSACKLSMSLLIVHYFELARYTLEYLTECCCILNNSETKTRLLIPVLAIQVNQTDIDLTLTEKSSPIFNQGFGIYLGFTSRL